MNDDLALIQNLIQADRFLILNIQGEVSTGRSSLISLLLGQPIEIQYYSPMAQIYSRIVRIQQYSIFVQILDNSDLPSHIILDTRQCNEISIQTRCDVDEINLNYSFYSSFKEKWICSRQQIQQLRTDKTQLQLDWQSVYKKENKRFYASNCIQKYLADKYNVSSFLEQIYQNRQNLSFDSLKANFSIFNSKIYQISNNASFIYYNDNMLEFKNDKILGFNQITTKITPKTYDWKQPYKIALNCLKFQQNLVNAFSHQINISIFNNKIQSSNIKDLEFFLSFLPKNQEFISEVQNHTLTIIGRTPIIHLSFDLGLFNNLTLKFNLILEHNTNLSEFDQFCTRFTQNSISIANQIFDEDNQFKFEFLDHFLELLGNQLILQNIPYSNILIRFVDFSWQGKVLNPKKIEQLIKLDFFVEKFIFQLIEQISQFSYKQEMLNTFEIILKPSQINILKQILAQRRGKVQNSKLSQQQAIVTFTNPISESFGIHTQLNHFFEDFQIQEKQIQTHVVH